MKYGQIFLGIIICITLEFFIYQLGHRFHLFKPIFTTTGSLSYEKHQGVGKFTNPLLECLGPEEQGPDAGLNLSKDDLSSFVDTIFKSGKVDLMSVYVRDLNNGPWISVNSEEKFLGASLLKVPVYISYIKWAEENPSILDEKIKYDKKLVDTIQYFKPSKEIEVGKTYTVEELLKYMIDESDNNAMQILVQKINLDRLYDTFEATGLGRPDISEPYSVDTKTYAGFFRILFNASYLTKNDSENALYILSQTEFNQGITALLPKNITVSHKFGIITENGVNQLHDCGIIYYPNHPYIACIMSRGGEFPDLANSIAKTSKFIYDHVSSVSQ
jgi:beta-lactamase class A